MTRSSTATQNARNSSGSAPCTCAIWSRGTAHRPDGHPTAIQIFRVRTHRGPIRWLLGRLEVVVIDRTYQQGEFRAQMRRQLDRQAVAHMEHPVWSLVYSS